MRLCVAGCGRGSGTLLAQRRVPLHLGGQENVRQLPDQSVRGNYHTIPYHTTQHHTIPYYTILYHTIPYYTIPYHTTTTTIIQLHAVLPCSAMLPRYIQLLNYNDSNNYM